jgi:hypothetical protein
VKAKDLAVKGDQYTFITLTSSSRAIIAYHTGKRNEVTTVALGIADRVWTIGDLIDAALATQPIDPVVTAPDRRKRFRVIEDGRKN